MHFCYWYYLIRGVWNNKQHKQRRRKIIKLGYNVIFEISMEYFKAQTWFGYGLILCGLCTCLTWSSSCWIIPIKQNFKHSLKNTVWQLKFCYFYFIVIIIAIIIFFKSKKDKLYSLHYWIDSCGWSLLKADKVLVIQSNQRLTWICQISQHTAKKLTKWIIITSNISHNNKS